MGTICKRRNKEEERKKRQNERKDLTLTGLLMEGFEVKSFTSWLLLLTIPIGQYPNSV
jgi:hypothetical protein